MYIYDYMLLFGWFWWLETLCKINRMREMVSLDLSKEIEKDVFRLVTSVGQRETSESLWGIENQTFRALYWATETLRWARSITKSMTRVPHTARTRIVDSITVDNFFFILHSWQDEKHLSLSLCILTWKFQIADLMKMLFFCLVIPTSFLSNNKLKILPDGLFNSLSKLTHLWVK